MEYFIGIGDLSERWPYSRQGVHNVIAREDFPQPFFSVNRGRVKVWRVPEIEAYEKLHPELLDPVAKVQKQRGYFLARRKGRPPENAPSMEAQ